MKKLFITLVAVCALATAGFSQEAYRPVQGTWGVGFDVTGIANVAFFNNTDVFGNRQIHGKYYIADDLALRLGLGVNSNSVSTERTDSLPTGVPDSVGFEMVNIDRSNLQLGINVGIEKHFATGENSKVDPYVGADILIGLISPMKTDSMAVREYPINNMTTVTSTTEMAGGFGFGVNLLAGFNYFFTPNFALGAEVGWGFFSRTVGGETTVDMTTEVTDGTTTTTASSSDAFTNKVSSSGLSVGSTAGINATIFW